MWKSFFGSTTTLLRPTSILMTQSMDDTTQAAKGTDASPSESGAYKDAYHQERQGASKLKIALVATASLLVGGLAAAWYYRRTVSLLRNHPVDQEDSNFGIFSPGEDSEI